MTSTVAVAVDGSEASAQALVLALRLAADGQQAIRGVFVLDAGWADYIGNDWQSSRDARQGFLDYVRSHLERQAEVARRQFEEAAGLGARFSILTGDPLEELCGLIGRGDASTLVAGREVFQVCGRPSLKRLAKDLRRRLGPAAIII